MLYDVIITLITTDTVSDCGRRSPLMFIDQHFEKKINSLSPEIPSRKPFLLYQCFYMCETKSLTVLQHAVCCDFFPVFFFLPGCPIIIVIFVCIFCLKKNAGFRVCLPCFIFNLKTNCHYLMQSCLTWFELRPTILTLFTTTRFVLPRSNILRTEGPDKTMKKNIRIMLACTFIFLC